MLKSIFRIIHFDAPSYLGGWGGRSDIDICSHLTNLKSSFWHIKQEDCEDIIEENYNKSYRVFLSFGAVLIFFMILRDSYSAVKTILYHYLMSKVERRDNCNKKIYLTVNDNNDT